MTKERFVESIENQGWNRLDAQEDIELWEREGAFFFLFEDAVSSSRNRSDWVIPFSDIRVTRSRRHFFEIEKADGSSTVVLSEEDDEIGCMG